MKTVVAKKTRRLNDQDHCARRHEEILETAAKLFAQHGYSETDTQLLADQLGVGKGTLYRYFPSKRDLFLAAADRVMVKLREHVDASIVGVADPLDQIAVAIRAYLAFFAAQPGFVELLIQERAQFKDRKKPTYFEHRERNIVRWREMYRQLIACGRIRPMPVERITNVLGNLVYGTMFTNYFTGPNKPFEEQAREILDIVFQGILTESERKRWQEPSPPAEKKS
jgi:AcrR family transcriptional regulator